MLLTSSVHVTENWKCSFWNYKTKKEQENMWVLVTTLSLILKGLKRKDLKFHKAQYTHTWTRR